MKTALLVPLLIVAIAAAPVHSQSPSITLSPVVKQTGVRHAGINVDDASYLLKDNLLFDNQGFEQPTVAVTINCAVVNGTKCITDDPYAQWPEAFANNFSYRGQVAGDTASGTVLYQYPANGSQGMTLYLSSAPTTSHLVLEGTFPSQKIADISGWVTPGNGSVSVETYDAGDGQQSLLLDGTNGYQQILHYFDNVGAARSSTQLNAPYQLRFLAKPGTSSRITVDVTRLLSNGNEVMLHSSQDLQPGWQQYVIPFNPTENGTQIGNAQVTFEVDGGTVLLDDISMPRVESSNPTPFRSAALNSLRGLQPGSLRFMIAPGYGVRLEDAISPINLRRPALYATTVTQAQRPSVDYFQAMQLAQTLGARPWITIPLSITQAEMAELVEWLAGSSSTPYGAKRAARGQVAPWTSVFDTIYLEYGNEAWNSAVDGNNGGDPDTYGRRVNDVFTAAHASSSWRNGITLVADGWSTNSIDGGTELFWEQHVRQHVAVPFMMSEAPYLYTSFNDASSIESIYGPLYAEVQAFNNPLGGLNQKVLADLRANGDDVGLYEENLGTDTGTASQAQFDQLTGTVGSAVAVADNLLQVTGLGIQVQNVFDFYNLGARASGGQLLDLWGTVIDAGGSGNIQRPTYLAEQVVNASLLPTMLTTIQANDPYYDSPSSSNDQLPAISHVTNLRSYAFTDGSKTSLVLINMSRTSSISSSVVGFPSGAPASVTQLTSPNITDSNELAQVVTVRDITSQWGGTTLSLPPFSVTSILWSPSTSTTAPPSIPVAPPPPTPPSPPAAAPVTIASPVLALGSGLYAGQIVDKVTGPAGSVLFFTSDGSLPTATHGYSCGQSLCAAGPMGSLTPFTAVACLSGVCSAPTYATYQFSPSGQTIAPRIAYNSGDQTVNVGSQASFFSVMYGSWPFQSTWTRNGAPTPSVIVPNGVASYTPPTAFQTADDGAQFLATFTNSGGSVADRPLTLHIPGGTGQGAPGAIAAPVLALGTGLYQGAIVDDVSGPAGSVLFFTSDGSLPTATHGYSCGRAVCAAGPMGSLTPFTAVACVGSVCSAPTYATYQFSSSGRLVAPQISYNSGDQSISPGVQAGFSSIMYGSWPFQASWTKNGTLTPSAVVPNGVATYTPLTTFQVNDDGAQFIATFSNGAGTVTDLPLTLHVAGGTGQGAPGQGSNAANAPTFSLGGGTYAGALIESIAGPAGTQIVWTNDGSLPSLTHGNPCAGAVCASGALNWSTTLTAVACTATACSQPTSAFYTISDAGRIVAPRISYGSGNLTATPGNSTMIYATPYGSFPFTASWTKNGSVVPSYFFNYGEITAVVQTNFQVADDGNQFAVTLTNAAGSYTSPAWTVQVVGGSGQGAPH